MDNIAGPSGYRKRSSVKIDEFSYRKKPLTNSEIVQCLEESDCSSDDSHPNSDYDGSSSSTEDEDKALLDSNLQDLEATNTVQFNQTAQGSTNTIWRDTGMLRKFPFKKQQKLLVPIPGEGRPIDFFKMIIDDNFLQTISEQTNKNAVDILCQPQTSEKSRITEWKDVTVDEMKIFIALLLHTGTISLSRLNDYWKTDPLFDIPVFRKYMSRNRFLLIVRCLHFTSEETDVSDRLGKIRSVIDFFNNKMERIYYPGRELSLDEAMVLWRGRLQFRQYIKNKRHKYGIKLYMLTEPNGLILKFRVYEGSSDVYSGAGHTGKIVLHLLEEKLDNGHAVYLDNFYNSVDLAIKLLEHDTYCTGTLRADRKQNPREVITTKLKRGENKSMFFNGVHVGKWRDKRNVIYITTEFGKEMAVFRNKRGQESNKPSAIIGYNKFMSGIDRQDQMMSYYPCGRKTIRWYKKLFVHVLQMSLINAFYLHNQYAQRGRLYDFRLDVIKNLLSSRSTPSIRPAIMNVSHTISKIEKKAKEIKGSQESKRVSRKECKVCRQKKIRKQTVYECKTCPGNPGFCLECFETYHKNVV